MVTGYTPDSPASKILTHLQHHGEATVRELGVMLGITATAVREHLVHLEARGLLVTRAVRQGPGRPRLVYSLTERAGALFAREYDMLATLLVQQLAERDPAVLTDVLDGVAARLAAGYGTHLGEGAIAARLTRLRDAYQARGIPSGISAAGDALEVFSCPYPEAARAHAAVCEMDRQVIGRVTGAAITLDGTIREGRRCCTFRASATPGDRSVGDPGA
jgi:DeoR family suf operon transcriptional repressor